VTHVGWVEMSIYRGAEASTVGEIKVGRRTEAQKLFCQYLQSFST